MNCAVVFEPEQALGTYLEYQKLAKLPIGYITGSFSPIVDDFSAEFSEHYGDSKNRARNIRRALTLSISEIGKPVLIFAVAATDIN